MKTSNKLLVGLFIFIIILLIISNIILKNRINVFLQPSNEENYEMVQPSDSIENL